MERPSRSNGKVTKNRGSSSILGNNPISAWVREKKNKRQQMKEEAAKIISNKKAENELEIAEMLKSINFNESNLSVEILDKKANPNQEYGDIELYILQAIELISNNTQDYTGIDLGDIDEGIYSIAKMAKQAIDGGNEKTAVAACRALLVTIGDVRDKIPTIPATLVKGYVENSSLYIEGWVNYILGSVSLDQNEKNAEDRKSKIDSEIAVLEKEKDDMAEKIKDDPAYKMRVEETINKRIYDDGWTPDMLDLRKKLLDQLITESMLEFKMLQYNTDVQKVAKLEGVLKTIESKLISLPTADDPDLMNKYNSMLKETYEEAAKVDNEFSEFVDSMKNMRAQIEQLQNSPGSIKMKNILLDQANKLAEKARQKQLQEENLVNEQSNGGIRLKLYTPEQIQKIKQENRIQEQYTNKSRERNKN